MLNYRRAAAIRTSDTARDMDERRCRQHVSSGSDRTAPRAMGCHGSISTFVLRGSGRGRGPNRARLTRPARPEESRGSSSSLHFRRSIMAEDFRKSASALEGPVRTERNHAGVERHRRDQARGRLASSGCPATAVSRRRRVPGARGRSRDLRHTPGAVAARARVDRCGRRRYPQPPRCSSGTSASRPRCAAHQSVTGGFRMITITSGRVGPYVAGFALERRAR